MRPALDDGPGRPGSQPADLPRRPQVAPTDGQGLRAEAWLPLLRDVLARQGRFTFPLRGNSMRPTLPSACEIEVLPLATPPNPGELLVFVLDDSLVAHRLVRRKGEILIAQGDNRRGPDRPLPPSQVVGRVSAAYAGGRQVWPRRGEALWTTFWLARHQLLRAARWVGLRVLR